MVELKKVFETEMEGQIERIIIWKVVGDPKMRYFSQLETDIGTWLIDPVDGEELEEIDDLEGVVVIHDRHWRDSAKLARNHEVPLYVPDFFEDVPEEAEEVKFFSSLPELGLKYSTVYDKRFWKEAILHSENLIVSGDSLGTSPIMGRKELYLNPFMRIMRPNNVFEGLKPEIILIGHGEPVAENASELLEEALKQSRISGVIDLGRFIFKMAT